MIRDKRLYDESNIIYYGPSEVDENVVDTELTLFGVEIRKLSKDLGYLHHQKEDMVGRTFVYRTNKQKITIIYFHKKKGEVDPSYNTWRVIIERRWSLTNKIKKFFETPNVTGRDYTVFIKPLLGITLIALAIKNLL